MSRKKYIIACPICGAKLVTIHAGAVEVECHTCGNSFFVKFSKDVMSLRETSSFIDDYNQCAANA